MEMSNQACQCQGHKLGHNKTRTSTTTETPAPTQHDANNTAATGQNRIMVSNYAPRPIHSNNTMPGYFRLPDYEPTKLDSLPAAPQTLFQKEQLLGMLDDFSKHMYDVILQNGISVPPSIDLGLNSMGDISLLGNHPDQSKIESLFGNNSSLALQFHQIAFTSRIQQLASLQPGFRGDFFQFPTNSIQQITFVHLRAVELKPFHMTIDQPEAISDTSLDKQIPRGEVFPFHLIISRAGATPVSSSVTDNQAPSKPEENIYTIDAPAPPKTVQPEPHKVEKHHHVHKGKMRCVINS